VTTRKGGLERVQRKKKLGSRNKGGSRQFDEWPSGGENWKWALSLRTKTRKGRQLNLAKNERPLLARDAKRAVISIKTKKKRRVPYQSKGERRNISKSAFGRFGQVKWLLPGRRGRKC